jgi:phytoene synthase
MTAPAETAQSITTKSKSNLALGLMVLPRDRRQDMTVFYAFCRIVDDIADEPSTPAEVRRAQLDAWRKSLETPFEGEPALAAEVRALIAKYRIPVAHFHEIIAGMEMDFAGARYRTFEDLRLYCYRVASAVGLVSIEIFGCKNPRSRDYALNLGLALQLTNIIRDVGEDWGNGRRVYLPLEEMERFHFTMDDLHARRQNEAFDQLIRFQAARAREFYALAESAFTADDARALVAAEIMRNIYKKLLDKMERGGFRVLDGRYSIGKAGKLAVIARTVLSVYLNRLPGNAVIQ